MHEAGSTVYHSLEEAIKRLAIGYVTDHTVNVLLELVKFLLKLTSFNKL